ncbi:3402_t:CDS:1, partial [Rhizophagus irregularis]
LENKIHDAEISKSTDPVSEESASSKAKKTEGKKQFQGGQSIPGTKKEIISPTDPSEDVLDLYKRTNNTLEKIKASGHPLISK